MPEHRKGETKYPIERTTKKSSRLQFTTSSKDTLCFYGVFLDFIETEMIQFPLYGVDETNDCLEHKNNI